jgi:hypothetical protein
MDKYINLFEYFSQCPQLKKLWSIAATEDEGTNVILPQGASPAVQFIEKTDVTGNYSCDVIPYPSLYEDFQINCYRYYDPKDSNSPNDNVNVLELAEVEKVCKWVEEQNNKREYPNIGEKIVYMECLPFVPQIRYTNPDESIVCYYITVRIRYVNCKETVSIEL